MKHSLQKAAHEHQVRFSNLHERRANVIAEVYERLVGVYEQSKTSTQVYLMGSSGTPEQIEHYNKVYKSNWELQSFIQPRRIYLPREACSLLDKCLKVMNISVINTNIYSKIETPFSPEAAQATNEILRNAYIAITEDVPKILELLETEFRKVLGDVQAP